MDRQEIGYQSWQKKIKMKEFDTSYDSFFVLTSQQFISSYECAVKTLLLDQTNAISENISLNPNSVQDDDDSYRSVKQGADN